MAVRAIVLAGGRGYRFWPRSSETMPKQFLALFGRETLLQATVARLGRFLSPDHIHVITGAGYKGLVREQVPGLAPGSVIVEPARRDTAAAIGYALTMIDGLSPDDVAVVVPSDHFISGVDAWVQAIEDACRAADTGRPVLVGIPPTRPETAYGYILVSGEFDGWGPRGPGGLRTKFYSAARFIEKPDRTLAECLITESRCLWNSGMFIWKAGVALELIRRHIPETARVLDDIARLKASRGAPAVGSAAWRARTATLFAGLDAVSIDYGVLEKCPDVIVALGEFGWDDVGGWEALARYVPGDDNENVVRGEVLLRGASRCIIDWSGSPALIVGMRDVVVAGGPGGLLVCPRDRLGELKDLVTGREFRRLMNGAQEHAAGEQQPATDRKDEKAT